MNQQRLQKVLDNMKQAGLHQLLVTETEPVYYQQRTLLADLVDALYEAGAGALEPVFAAQWRAASDDGVRLRAVIDQVASLTDVSASAWHARWCGMLSSQL